MSSQPGGIHKRYRNVGQCAAVHGGGEGPCGRPARAELLLPVSDLPPAEQSLHFYLEHLASPSPVLPMAVRLLAAAGGRPTVVRYSAGKDRTGLVTALLLPLTPTSSPATWPPSTTCLH